jgi:hypothetical protein
VPSLVDVWNLQTCDDQLAGVLQANAQLIYNSVTTERELFLARAAGRYGANPHRTHYRAFLEELSRHMAHRTIRGWHYTRLTDDEVATFRAVGITLSTPENARQRVAAQVARGRISADVADELQAASPLRDREQRECRSNLFGMRADPVRTDDGDVTLLLNHWGGEVVYFWLKSLAPHLVEIVQGLGSACVVEVAVPLASAGHTQAYRAAEAIAAAYARSLGCMTDDPSFDFAAVQALGPEAVLAIHTEGDATFNRIGRDYPSSFRPFPERV